MQENLCTLPIESVFPDPSNRPIDKDSQEFLELHDSIRTHGILQPLLVRECQDMAQDTYYELLAGHNRLEVAKDLGYKTVPCKIIVATDIQALHAQLVTNTHWNAMKPVDMARQLQRILGADPTLTKARLANEISKSPTWIDGILKLTNLEPEAARLANDGKMSLSNAQTLAKLPPSEQAVFVEAALTQTPAEFAPAVNTKVKALRDAGRQGTPTRGDEFVPQAHVRKPSDLKNLLADENAMAVAANVVGADSVASFRLAIQFCLSLDPASVREQRRKFDARGATK